MAFIANNLQNKGPSIWRSSISYNLYQPRKTAYDVCLKAVFLDINLGVNWQSLRDQKGNSEAQKVTAIDPV